MKHALLFPGQGSQSVGMGKALYDAFSVARDVIDEIDDVLSQKLSKLMFEGPGDELTLTSNTQPALMAVSVAVVKVLETESGFDWDNIDCVAGHSLGEYSALCASGSLSLADTARLLRIRGDAMQAAVPVGEGAMAALIGVDLDGASNAINAVALDAGVCEIANDNAPGQVVISGSRENVEAVCAIAKDHGAKMAKILPVSAPFHSSLMKPAAEKMAQALAAVYIEKPKVPVIANITAKATQDPEEIRDLLVQQVTGRVRWVESMNTMMERGVERYSELGAGKVLSGLVRRIAKEATIMNAGDPESIEALLG